MKVSKCYQKSAQTDDIQRFTELASAFTEPGDKEKADAVLQVSVAANRKKYDEVRRTSDMCEALRELMKEEIEEELKEKIWQDIKEINKELPTYQHMKNIIVTDEPMIKTTTAKIKRFEEIKKIIEIQ